jgi:hypothetical protein
MIDFIVDIRGHADQFEAFLQKLGYIKKNVVWTSSTKSNIYR